MNDKDDERWNQQKIFISAFLAALTIFAELPLWEVHGMTAVWASAKRRVISPLDNNSLGNAFSAASRKLNNNAPRNAVNITRRFTNACVGGING